MTEIQNKTDLMNFIIQTIHDYEDSYNGSLEEYLRSVWMLINKYKEHNVSYSLIGSIIREAFHTSPAEFQSTWLDYTTPPPFQEVMSTRNNITKSSSNLNKHKKVDFNLLKRTILFQIADLHRMKDNELKNEMRFFGIVSPTGNSWYNFDIFSYLECAIRGIQDRDYKKHYKPENANWIDLLII